MVVSMSSINSCLYVLQWWLSLCPALIVVCKSGNDGCLYVQRGQLSVCLAVMVVSMLMVCSPPKPHHTGNRWTRHCWRCSPWQLDQLSGLPERHRPLLQLPPPQCQHRGRKVWYWYAVSLMSNVSFYFFYLIIFFFSFFWGGGGDCLLWCLFQPNKTINFIR